MGIDEEEERQRDKVARFAIRYGDREALMREAKGKRLQSDAKRLLLEYDWAQWRFMLFWVAYGVGLAACGYLVYRLTRG